MIGASAFSGSRSWISTVPRRIGGAPSVGRQPAVVGLVETADLARPCICSMATASRYCARGHLLALLVESPGDALEVLLADLAPGHHRHGLDLHRQAGAPDGEERLGDRVLVDRRHGLLDDVAELLAELRGALDGGDALRMQRHAVQGSWSRRRCAAAPAVRRPRRGTAAPAPARRRDRRARARPCSRASPPCRAPCG